MRQGRQSPRVLVVDDNRLDREMASSAVREVADVECCANAEEALDALARESADLVLSDLTMPGLSGLDLLRRVAQDHPSTDFILVTAHASIDSAVAAMRMGAADYLRKPVRTEDLSLLVARTLERRRLRMENLRLRDLLATVEECRAFSGSLDASEIHGSALDVLLGRLDRKQGLAVFRRGTALSHDDVTFRGMSEREEQLLRDLLVAEKPLELDGLLEAALSRSGPLNDALQAAGVPACPLLMVPIPGGENDGGVLVVPEQGKPFSDHELGVARLVAAHARVAMQNAERYHRAKERAFVDDVTGAYNARYLFAALEHEMRRAERYSSELALLFLDLDRFKLVNDRHGHLVGSQTLRRLAEVLAGCIRQVDTLARYGGDEFTILLADTGLDTGLVVAERIRAAVAAASFETRGSGELHVTVSVGVAAFPAHAEAPEQLLDAADKAMYRAKSLGRDRVCSASEL